jgi:hypothetical protein
MAPGLPRTSFNSSSLVRSLAKLPGNDQRGDADSKQTLAERLSAWLDWTDAISISTALNGASAVSPDSAASMAPLADQGIADEVVRVRAELAKSITTDALLNPGQAASKPAVRAVAATTEAAVEFLPYRRNYLGHQRAMASRIGALRLRLRAALAAQSPALGQLAALDAALDQALAARERHLLSKVPQWLQREFERLRQANERPAVKPSTSLTQAPGLKPAVWVAEYGRTMREVLLAEMDTKLLPVEGMMDALLNGLPRQP